MIIRIFELRIMIGRYNCMIIAVMRKTYAVLKLELEKKIRKRQKNIFLFMLDLSPGKEEI